MKGIVFTEFLDMVENKFGLEIIQRIIDECDLESEGIFTSVGTYNHQDMFKMVGKLSQIKNIPIDSLLEIYGEYFFSILAKSYPSFMNQKNCFAFLESIDNYIHPEVLKLYPKAELPSFKTTFTNNKEMTLVYQSTRKMSDFAIGLIKGSAEYYDENFVIKKKILDEHGEKVELKIQKIG